MSASVMMMSKRKSEEGRGENRHKSPYVGFHVPQEVYDALAAKIRDMGDLAPARSKVIVKYLAKGLREDGYDPGNYRKGAGAGEEPPPEPDPTAEQVRELMEKVRHLEEQQARQQGPEPGKPKAPPGKKK